MSKYTITLYDLMCDVNKDNTGLSIDEKINNLAPLLFDFNYPYPSEDDKKRIENAIIKHYLMREIAFETVGLFKLKLNDRLNLIMPKYNQAYKNLDENISPYINNYINETTENNRDLTSNGNSENTQTNNDDTFETTSDTPQGILTELKEGKYSSGARASVSNSSLTNNSNMSNTDKETVNGTRNVESLQGMNKMQAFREYYDNLISIDEELVYEFSDLFMILY